MEKNSNTKKKRILRELYNICTDSEAKPSDRISAAKLFLDNMDADASGNENTLHVVFENIDPEYTE